MIPLLVLVTLSSCSSEARRYHVWFTPGQIQALGNENELWIFLEIDKMAYRPNVGYDTPKIIPIGHFQEVVVLQRDGSRSRFRVSIDNGVTFHPNISLIFRAKGQLYLYMGESMFFKTSLFVWKRDHFELLSLETGDKFLDQYFSKDRKISLDELKKLLPLGRAEEIFRNTRNINVQQTTELESHMASCWTISNLRQRAKAGSIFFQTCSAAIVALFGMSST